MNAEQQDQQFAIDANHDRAENKNTDGSQDAALEQLDDRCREHTQQSEEVQNPNDDRGHHLLETQQVLHYLLLMLI